MNIQQLHCLFLFGNWVMAQKTSKVAKVQPLLSLILINKQKKCNQTNRIREKKFIPLLLIKVVKTKPKLPIFPNTLPQLINLKPIPIRRNTTFIQQIL